MDAANQDDGRIRRKYRTTALGEGSPITRGSFSIAEGFIPETKPPRYVTCVFSPELSQNTEPANDNSIETHQTERPSPDRPPS